MNENFPKQIRQPSNPVFGFAQGLQYPIKAIVFILKSPSLWPWCIIPLIINVTVLWFSWSWLTNYSNDYINAYTSSTGFWASVLRYALVVVAFVIRVLAVVIMFIIVGSIAALPFNDFLSEKTDKLANNWVDPNPFNTLVFVKNLLVTLLQEIKRISIFLLILMPLFFVSFIPIIAPFAIAVKLLVTAMFFATDYLSYPLERRGTLLFKDKMRFAKTYSHISIGFGLAVTCIALIPLVNFLLFPLAVVGGTLMYGDLERYSRHNLKQVDKK